MKFEDFKSTLDAVREIDVYVNKLDELEIHLYETPLFDNLCSIEKALFSQIYGEEGYDWITWYLYEMPYFNKKIEEEGDKKEYHAWDENNNPIDLSTDEKLWELLEKDYGTH